ncbi:hypothetical protein EJB05_16596, partial [Eragrostis curvula]
MEEEAMRRWQSAIEKEMRAQASDSEDLKKIEATLGMVGDIRDAPGSENDPDIINIAWFAVSEHNNAANALEFEKVVKVREQAVHGTVYYLTIEAKDGEAKKLYEAEVYDDWHSKRLHNFWPAEHVDSDKRMNAGETIPSALC